MPPLAIASRGLIMSILRKFQNRWPAWNSEPLSIMAYSLVKDRREAGSIEHLTNCLKFIVATTNQGATLIPSRKSCCHFQRKGLGLILLIILSSFSHHPQSVLAFVQ